MKYSRAGRLLAMVLALLMLATGVAEELGEMSLYDPSIFTDGIEGDDLPEGSVIVEIEGQLYISIEGELIPLDEYERVVTAEEQDAEFSEAPAQEPVEQPTEEPTEESTEEPTPEPTVEPTPEPADQPTAEPTLKITLEPTAEPTLEPTAEPTLEPTAEPTISPTPEAAVAAPQAAQVMASTPAPDLSMGVGERYALDGGKLLRGAGAVSGYASSNAEVASIDAKTGVITAQKIGRAEIVVSSATGERVVYYLEVLNAPSKAAFTSASLTLGKKETRTLPLQLPAGSASAQVAYKSSKPSVVAVDAQGNIYGKKTGTAVITAATYNGKKASCKVTVRKAPGKVTLSAAALTVCENETGRLTVKLPKKTASAITWTTSDAGVATVDASGNVRGVKPGVATVTATAFNGKKASCKITVLQGKAPTKLTLNTSGLKLGKKEKFQLVPSVGEGEAAAYAYASSNKKIAAVSAGGVITAKKKGTAKITVRTHNGLKQVIKVKVVKAPSKVTLSPAGVVLHVGQTSKVSAKLTSGSASAIAWSSGSASVASVDAGGNITALKAGTAVITAAAFNGKKGTCKVVVLDGKAPTKLTLNATGAQLGVGEKFTITPAVGEGEAAVYAYSTSKKKVAAVSAGGVITAKKAGTAVITVKTHNGLQASVTVKVANAPSKVTLSASKLALQAGQSAQLTAKLPSGTVSKIAWSSSDASVASVDANGKVTAQKGGKAVITAATFNGKKAACTVTVDNTAAAEQAAANGTTTKAQMADNLKKDSSLGLGGKKDAIVGVVELLMNNGFEPAFAAGVAANIYSEGTYGLFESSKYVSNPQKRPKYFAYLDGGNYYTLKDGKYVVSAVYLSQEEYDAYTGTATKNLRYGEANYYLNNYSKKYAQDVNLTQLEAFLAALSKGGWKGKFGLGVVQWTGGRTKTLVSFYRKHAGSGNSITKAQVIAAENEMILYELQGSYSSVYTTWKKNNSGGMATLEAARSAGALVCTKYEIPADKDAKAVTRGAKAASIYKVMIGG